MKSRKLLSSLLLIISITLLAAVSACSALPAVASGPTQTPVVVTQVVTRVVTQDVNQETTRIVDVPVTVTPGPTAEPTGTPDPSRSNAGTYPQASLPAYTDCLYGPADFYVYKTSFPAGQQVEVLGQSEDGKWAAVDEVGGWNPCWVKAEQVQMQAGNLQDLPIVNTIPPKSEYEFGSPYTTVKRNGDEVTVAWSAIYMSRDEVQGYLIDAYVCQGGQHIHLPVFVHVTFAENVGTISTKIIDEAGCAEPSTAHIVSYGTRGFAEWEKIFWPTH